MEKGSDTERSKQDQTSPGVLNEDLIGHFKTTREDIVELAIDSIEPFPLIPDYRDPTESIYPIIIKSPEACRCVDGWNLIEGAKAAGNSSIRCHVFEMENHSDTEFAIHKTAARTKSLGGTFIYPELVRNTCLLERPLMEECENPIMHSHGGARRGDAYTGNREDDVRGILAERLGKSRTTINQYLAHGRHLDDQLLEDLIVAEIGKAFFEKAQVNKRRWIGILEGKGKTPEEITVEISGKIREWLSEFQESGKIVPDLDETDSLEEAEGAGTETLPIEEQEDAEEEHTETFRDGSEPESGEPPELPTETDVRDALNAHVEAVSNLMGNDQLDVAQAIQVLEEQIARLARVRSQLVSIRDRVAGQNEEVP